MGKAIILDCESTGLVEPIDAVEIAYHYIDTNFKRVEENFFYSKFMPNVAIHPKASEVHGFTKDNLKGQPNIDTFIFPTDVSYMIGHNILYDYKVIKKPNVKLICTKELSVQYLTKRSGAGTKGLNTLTGLITRYYPDIAETLISKAHSAAQDIELCYLILLKILEVAPELDSFGKLAAQCTQPNGSKNISKLPYLIEQDSYTKHHLLKFGKYNGISLEVLVVSDKNYLIWIVKKSTMPQDLKDFIKQFMIDNK